METVQQICNVVEFLKMFAENAMKNVTEMQMQLYEKKDQVKEIIKEYNKKRMELVKKEIDEREMTWCTCCSQVIPKGESEFILIEGRGKYSHGYEDSYYGFRDFYKLHRACSSCKKRAMEKHGTIGDFDSLANDRESFFAFRVKESKGEYYANKHGIDHEVDKKLAGFDKLDKLPDFLFKDLIEKWNFPPKIECDY